MDGVMYRRSYSVPLLRCVMKEKAKLLMVEVHEGFCGNHVWGKASRKRYWGRGTFGQQWSKIQWTMSKGVKSAKDSPKIPRTTLNELKSMQSPWTFTVRGINLIDSLSKGKDGVQYAVVVVDYFTKWNEVEPLATITSKKVLNFVVKNIICCYRLPQKIVSDNIIQSDNELLIDLCERHRIIKSFSAVTYPQANGQVEFVNQTLKDTLENRLE